MSFCRAPARSPRSDIELAIASGAVVIWALKCSMDTAARKKAESNGIDVRFYEVIYKLIEDVELAMKGYACAKDHREGAWHGRSQADVQDPEDRRHCRGVRSRPAWRSATSRRACCAPALPIFAGEVGSLRRLTEDVKEVRTGFECGVALDGFGDYKTGDVIEFLTTEEQAR